LAPIRPRTWPITRPKIKSHSNGCAARKSNSMGSFRSFRNLALVTANT
jgi:hypothetical protein